MYDRKEILRKALTEHVGDVSGMTAVDLGAMTGYFSFAMEGMGLDVVAIEARETNIADARKEVSSRRSGVRFVRGDVKLYPFSPSDRYDIVLAFGILYHLDRPVEWLRSVCPTAARAVVVDTHYAPEAPEGSCPGPGRMEIGPLESVSVRNVRYRGRKYREYRPGKDREDSQDLRCAAWSNPWSFWLTPPSLVRAMTDAGLSDVTVVADDQAFMRMTLVGLVPGRGK